MRNFIIIIIFFIVNITSFSVEFTEADSSFLKYPINKIKFVGIKNMNLIYLKNSIKTKESTIFKKNYINKEILKEDIEKIKKIYYDNGYNDFSLDSCKLEFKENKINILFYLQEREQSIIEKLDYVNLNNFEIRDFTENYLKRKKIAYSNWEISLLKEELNNYLLDKGYWLNEIEAVVDTIGKNKYKVTLITYRGKIFYLGKVSLKSKTISEEHFIRNFIKDKDNVARRNEIVKLKHLLKNEDLIEDVEVEPIYNSETDRIDLRFDIKEKKNNYIALGTGYSKEDFFRFLFTIGKRNLTGKIDPLSFSVINGVRFTPKVQTTNIYFLLDYQTLLYNNYYFITELFYLNPNFINNSNEYVGNSTKIEYKTNDINWFIELYLSYKSNYKKSVLDEYFLIRGINLFIANNQLEIEDKYRKIEKKFSISNEINFFGGFLKGDINYIKYENVLKYYFPITNNFFIDIKNKFDFLFNNGRKKIEQEQYLVFGISSGFRGGYDNINDNTKKHKFLWLSTIESSIRTYNNFYLSPFIDFGNSYKNINNYDIKKINFCYGVGGIYLRRLNFIRFDLAIYKKNPYFQISAGENF